MQMKLQWKMHSKVSFPAVEKVSLKTQFVKNRTFCLFNKTELDFIQFNLLLTDWGFKYLSTFGEKELNCKFSVKIINE